MRNKLLVLFLIAISSVAVFPAENTSKSSERTFNERTTELQYQRRGSYRQRRRSSRRDDRRRYYPRRYRNYGQYRRTRTRGYRRSRLVRQYYYRSGRRYVRYVRVYY